MEKEKPVELIVPPQLTPIRIDQFLHLQFPQYSRRFWSTKLLSFVGCEGRTVRKGMLLHGGEIIAIHELPTQINADKTVDYTLIAATPDFLIIDKPAGVAMYPLAFEETGTLIQGLLYHYPELYEVGKKPFELGLIHRLDTPTSGLVLVGRNQNGYDFLRKELKEGRIVKEYQAIVQGPIDLEILAKEWNLKKRFDENQNWVEVAAPIAHHPKNSKKMLVCSDSTQAKKYKAQIARTWIQVTHHSENLSLLKIRLLTGVRHQIRVHLSLLGHPIVGDPLYNTHPIPSLLSPRMYLHACRLSFKDPKTFKEINIENINQEWPL